MSEKSIKSFLLTLTIIFLSVLSTSCSYDHKDQVKATDYSTMEHIGYTQMLSMEERVYYIYIHRDGCEVCASLEDLVVNYYNTGKFRVYAVNTSEERNQGIKGKCFTTDNCKNTIPLNATDYNQVKIVTSPVLIKIKKGKIVEVFDGATAIKKEIK